LQTFGKLIRSYLSNGAFVNISVGASVRQFFLQIPKTIQLDNETAVLLLATFLADRTPTQYDRLLRRYCRLSVCPSVCLWRLCIVALRVGV